MEKDASAAAFEPGASATMAAHIASAVAKVTLAPRRASPGRDGPTCARRARSASDLPGSDTYAAMAAAMRWRSVMPDSATVNGSIVNRLWNLAEPAADYDARRMTTETLGARIKRLRGDMSQYKLAKLAGMSQGRLADIERGDTANPRGDTLMKLARALGAPLSALTGEAQPEELREPEAAPYEAGDGRAICILLAPEAAQPVAYQIARDMPLFSLCAGDVVVLDAKAAPKPGDLVVANLADESGEAETVIRRFAPPFLIPPAGGALDSVDAAAIFGPVVASWRTAR